MGFLCGWLVVFTVARLGVGSVGAELLASVLLEVEGCRVAIVVIRASVICACVEVVLVSWMGLFCALCSSEVSGSMSDILVPCASVGMLSVSARTWSCWCLSEC